MDDELQKTALPLGAAAGAAARFLLPKLMQGGRAAARAWQRVPNRQKLDMGLDADDVIGGGPALQQAPEEAPSVPSAPSVVPYSRPDRVGNMQRAVIRGWPTIPLRGA